MKSKLFIYVIFTFIFFSHIALGCDENSLTSGNNSECKGFKNIAPVLVKAGNDYKNVCSSLKRRHPELISALTFDDHTQTIKVHLPCQMVSKVFSPITTLHWQFNATYLSSLFDSEWPSGMHYSIAFCSLSFEEELLKAFQDAWASNNETVPHVLKWSGNRPHKFHKSRELLDYIFKENKHKGFISGEGHIDFYARYWLAKKLPLLVQEYDVATLALEAIPQEFQDLLNTYMLSERTAGLPKELRIFLQMADSLNNWNAIPEKWKNKSSYTYLLETAKACGVKKIIAIDDAKYYFPVPITSKNKAHFQERMVTMNQVFPKKMPTFEKNCAVLNGTLHSTLFKQDGKIVYGLRELSGFPAIEFCSSMSNKDIQESSIVSNDPQAWRKDGVIEYQESDFTIYKHKH